MGKKKFDQQLFFGRCLALLLVMLFVLTGTQMGLSLVRDYSKGTVLGEESDDDDKENKESNKWWNRRGKELTVSPRRSPEYGPPSEEKLSPTAVPTEAVVSPTATVTSEEPPSVSPSEEPAQATTTTSPSAGETAPTALQSGGQVVRTILRQIGLPVRLTPTPAPQPEVITVKEEVINERQAGEILKELETAVGPGIQREARLRFVISDGRVGLMAEVKAGQGVPLAASEAARINESLKMGSGLTIGRGSDTGLVFSRGTAMALTDLPLLVDLDSNTLTVETSLGIKDVAILPDTAVTRALAAGALTAVDPEQIELVERDDGKIAYRMSGLVGRKLFGLFDIKAEKTVDVSVESGRVLSSLTDSLGATLFNLVAPEIR